MPKRITTRYPGECEVCGAEIPVGRSALWIRRGVIAHPGCWDHRDDSEYMKGVADANRYMSDVQIYGRELAEQWEIEREMREGWDY